MPGLISLKAATARMLHRHGMSETADRIGRCHAPAQACRARAKVTFDPVIRWDLTEVAEQWESIARDVEQIARLRSQAGMRALPAWGAYQGRE